MRPVGATERRLTIEQPVACRYCDHPIEIGCEAVHCPRCKAIHHLDCWKEKGGCATRGCMQVATVVRRDAAPPRPVGDETRSARRRRAQIALAAIPILLLALLYGVRNVRTSPAAPDVPTLHILVWSSPGAEDALRTSVDRFSAARPHLDVQIEVAPLGLPAASPGASRPSKLYDQKLVVTMAARAAPDIFALPADRLTAYAESGALLPLDPFVEGGKFERGGRVGARVYALPNPIGDGWFAVWRGTEQPRASWELLSHIVTDLGSE